MLRVTSYKSDDKQAGVTLVVAIVMLASVTFISFSISSIVIREIGSARLILKTEPAISAANAGGEVGLYQLLRETGVISPSGNLGQSSVSYQVTTKLYDNPYVFSIPAGGQADIALYDPTNFNNTAADYGSVTITNNFSSHPLNYTISSWSDLAAAICSGNIGSGQTAPVCPLGNPDDRYIITLVPTGNAAASGQITATNNAGQAKGVPADFPSLSVTGVNGDVQRKIQINLGP